MKRVSIGETTRRPLVYTGALPKVSRDDLVAPARIAITGRSVPMPCVRCPGHRCDTFSRDEIRDGIRRVCPVDAIQFESDGRVRILPNCIGCGLCVIRCPYGSLGLPERGPAIKDDSARGRFVPVGDDDEFNEYWGGWSLDTRLDAKTKHDLIQRIVLRAADLAKDEFYPLVARLLTGAGFPAIALPVGDTSNRIDVVIQSDVTSIPVEVKAPVESLVLNVKAVQQALENKVVIDTRKFWPTTPATTSLAIGYFYPPNRSDVYELIDDIYAVHGIRIGLLDLATLVRIAIEHALESKVHPWSVLGGLQGPAII